MEILIYSVLLHHLMVAVIPSQPQLPNIHRNPNLPGFAPSYSARGITHIQTPLHGSPNLSGSAPSSNAGGNTYSQSQPQNPYGISTGGNIYPDYSAAIRQPAATATTCRPDTLFSQLRDSLSLGGGIPKPPPYAPQSSNWNNPTFPVSDGNPQRIRDLPIPEEKANLRTDYSQCDRQRRSKEHSNDSIKQKTNIDRRHPRCAISQQTTHSCLEGSQSFTLTK